MQNSPSNWNQLIQEHLLKDNLVNGCCLLSPIGDCMYSVGILSDLSNDETFRKQFLHLFDVDPNDTQPPSFTVGTELYIVYSRSLCSMYSISRQRISGLLVHLLPFGILLTTYTRPHIAQQVIPVVEKFCDKIKI